MSTRRRAAAKAPIDDESGSEDELPEVVLHIERRRSAWKYFALTLFGLSVLMGAACLYVYFGTSKETFIPRAMTPNMPTVQCRPVSREDALTLLSDVHWQHTVRSMHWHLEAGELEGISAFHVGDPTCFILVRTTGGVLGMFNPVIKGYSPSNIVARDEESLACPGVIRNMVRAMHIRVNYIDAVTFDDMTERFSGGESFAIQHVNFYSLGKTICDLHASNADQGIATLRKLITSDIFS